MTHDYTLEKANAYIDTHTVDPTHYPKLNFAAPVGWINDPNGMSFYQDQLHLFYQHYPYGSIHGKMHWGHATTTDGVHWEHLPVALAPDQPYDKDGVFSGSAIEKDGKLYVIYTGHVELPSGEIRQYQNVAISEDGVHFKKYAQNPVLAEVDVPEGSSINDFRDPKVFVKNDRYYMVVGSRTTDEKGQVLLYVSNDLLNWDFQSVILPYHHFLGDMVECPDLLLFEKKDVFLLSAMNYTDPESGEFHSHITWLVEGKVNWETFEFEVSDFRQMDVGFDYYAPQSARLPQKKDAYVTIAWQQGWNRTLPTHDKDHGWAGQMTLPRVLEERDGKIIQAPYASLMEKVNLREVERISGKITKTNLSANYLRFDVPEETVMTLHLTNDVDEAINVHFDAAAGQVTLDRKATMAIKVENQLLDEITNPVRSTGTWTVDVFLDTSSIQVFINAYDTVTSTFYVDHELDTLTLSSHDNKTAFDLQLGDIA